MNCYVICRNGFPEACALSYATAKEERTRLIKAYWENNKVDFVNYDDYYTRCFWTLHEVLFIGNSREFSQNTMQRLLDASIDRRSGTDRRKINTTHTQTGRWTGGSPSLVEELPRDRRRPSRSAL